MAAPTPPSGAPGGPGDGLKVPNQSLGSHPAARSHIAAASAAPGTATAAVTQAQLVAVQQAHLLGMMSQLAAASQPVAAPNGRATTQPPTNPVVNTKLGEMPDAELAAELEQFIEDTDPSLEVERNTMQRVAAVLRNALVFKVDGCVITKAEKEFAPVLQATLHADCFVTHRPQCPPARARARIAKCALRDFIFFQLWIFDRYTHTVSCNSASEHRSRWDEVDVRPLRHGALVLRRILEGSSESERHEPCLGDSQYGSGIPEKVRRGPQLAADSRTVGRVFSACSELARTLRYDQHTRGGLG